jgi:DNA invertase Pin-like site-specific DNA recombinase
MYGRYSCDKQKPTSIDDQLNRCRQFAERQGWHVLDECVYADSAVSGRSTDRPQFKRMMAAARSEPRPFDIILIYDTSRLSRSLVDVLKIYEELNFLGIRVVAVSQGIDSQSEHAPLLLSMLGTIDQEKVKGQARDIHRGLESNARKGLSVGGHCYGYDVVAVEGGKRLVVNKREAARLRRIFALSAEGYSLRTICKRLNADRKEREWYPSLLAKTLHNRRYLGELIWNRTRSVKRPGTNRRVFQPRPREEWRMLNLKRLRIISHDLFEKVERRLQQLNRKYGPDRRPGLFPRSASSPHLFSGFLVCGRCGNKLRTKHGRYGCPRNLNRGTCSNDLRERQDRLERRLLEGLQEAVLGPEVVNYAIRRVEEEVARQLQTYPTEMAGLRRRQAATERKLRHLVGTIEGGHYSPTIEKAIAEREQELQTIEVRLRARKPALEFEPAQLRSFVCGRLRDLRGLLYTDVDRARTELACHVGEITMRPVKRAGRRYYVASGEWNLLPGLEYKAVKRSGSASRAAIPSWAARSARSRDSPADPPAEKRRPKRPAPQIPADQARCFPFDWPSRAWPRRRPPASPARPRAAAVLPNWFSHSQRTSLFIPLPRIN